MQAIQFIIEDTNGATEPAYVKTLVPFSTDQLKINAMAWDVEADRDTVMNALNNGGNRFVPGTRPKP